MDDVDPYRAPTANVEPPIDARADRASRGARLGAVAIDVMCACAAWIPPILFGVVSAPMRAQGAIGFTQWVGIVLSILSSLVLMVVQGVQLHRHSATIGKRALGLRIVRTDGEPATFTRVFWMRALAPGLLCAWPGSTLVCCGMLWCVTVPVLVIDGVLIFGPEQRCGHDYIADTSVITTRREQAE